MATRARPRACPWVNFPTHKRNRELQVNGERPLVYGYCGQELDCASCAGTLYKPNLVIEQGRSFLFVECPFCSPDAFRRRVTRLSEKLPRGAGPSTSPAQEKDLGRPADEAGSKGRGPRR